MFDEKSNPNLKFKTVKWNAYSNPAMDLRHIRMWICNPIFYSTFNSPIGSEKSDKEKIWANGSI